MQLVTAQNNLSECLFLAVSQWESRLPALKDGVREFFDAVPRIMHFLYSVAVLAWYTLVALGALSGYLVIGLVHLMRRSFRLGRKARQSMLVVRIEGAVRPVVEKYVAPAIGKFAICAQPLISFLQFAKTEIANFFSLGWAGQQAVATQAESESVATKSWLNPNSDIDDISF